MLTFWVVFMTGECGNIGTPPLCGKISHLIPFFSDEWHARLVLGPFNQYQVTQIDQISLPPYCKTCFSTSGWFWHAKKTWQTDKKKWVWVRPPPLVLEKFPRKVVFFWRKHIFEIEVSFLCTLGDPWFGQRLFFYSTLYIYIFSSTYMCLCLGIMWCIST